MDERTQGALLLAVGGVALRLGLTDAALAYVRAGLRPLLVAAGIILVVLGIGAVMQAFRAERALARAARAAVRAGIPPVQGQPTRDAGTAPVPGGHPEGSDGLGHGGHGQDGHGHGGHGPAVAWLLVLPLLALLLIAPPPLGAFAANRQSSAPPSDTGIAVTPLPVPVDGAVELPVVAFVYWALYDEGRTLEGERVRLTGFVSDDAAPEGYVLSRFVVSCCAADGRAVSVEIADDEPSPPVDTWLTVEGTWQPREGVEPGEPDGQPPVLRVERRTVIEPPTQPYEY